MKKKCPVLSAGVKYEKDMWDCLEGECAWWLKRQGCCAVMRIVMVQR